MLPSLPEEETTQLVHNEAAQQKWKLWSTRTQPPSEPHHWDAAWGRLSRNFSQKTDSKNES